MVKVTSVESGVCLGFGGTNARRAVCENGDIRSFTSIETPARSREFFGWMARQVLRAGNDGHSWMVAGYPGPVTEDGKLIGPLANVPGMSQKQYDLREELVAADTAVDRLLGDGFMLIGVNDGTLAAHAAASKVGDNKYAKTGALILGTGVGSGVVEKNKAYSNVHHVDKSNPLEIGHLPLSADPFDTFEARYAGPAMARTYDMDPRDMPADHPAWQAVGVAAGRMATTMGLMNGVELVVPTGGVGAGASDKYGPHLERFMATYREYGNGPQKLFAPEVAFVDPSMSQEFEMFGAEGVVRDYLVSSVA
jgi:predicted NBD/HSP70 family sugar kinase